MATGIAGDADEPTVLHFQGPIPEAEEVADLTALAACIDDVDAAHGVEWVEGRIREVCPLNDAGWQNYRIPALAPRVIRIRSLMAKLLGLVALLTLAGCSDGSSPTAPIENDGGDVYELVSYNGNSLPFAMYGVGPGGGKEELLRWVIRLKANGTFTDSAFVRWASPPIVSDNIVSQGGDYAVSSGVITFSAAFGNGGVPFGEIRQYTMSKNGSTITDVRPGLTRVFQLR